MPHAITQVLEIEYSDEGDGPPVLLVHGWPDAARGWDAVRAGLVQAGHRVVVPSLRGSGGTRFRERTTARDGTAVALAQDVLDLADAISADRFAVVGHDWGARVGYTLAAVAPERLTSITALALGYQPRGEFRIPDSFDQCRSFWYQWLMCFDAGAEAIRRDPVTFARKQWETWSPPGWFDEPEFAATAESFRNPDWTAITLNAYRTRYLAAEQVDARYAELRQRLSATDRLHVPTVMVQGAADACDPPETSEGLDGYFETYRRVVLPGVGHFPHREATDAVLAEVVRQLSEHS